LEIEFMRAYHLNTFGNVDGLVIRQHEVPQPGPGEVLVRVRAVSLNYRDLLVLNDRYHRPISPGTIPIADGAGEVVAIGPDVRRFAVGDRVTSTYIPLWIDGKPLLEHGREQWGSFNDGLLTEYKVMHEEKLVRMPDHLTYEEASTLPCAGLTAWSSLTGPRPVMAGDTVLTLGTGGVALFALQFAKLFGARVISTTSSEEKAKRLLELGAAHVVNYRKHPDWHVSVRALTDNQGVDHIVETTGAETLERSTKAGSMDCQIALVGVMRMSGPSAGIDLAALHGGYTLRRIRVGSRAAYESMIKAVRLQGRRPIIDRGVQFDEARDGYK